MRYGFHPGPRTPPAKASAFFARGGVGPARMGLCICIAVVSCVFSLAGCLQKVPVRDVGAAFAVADAVWFEEEETLFFFYRVDASQGLNETSRIEISFETDDEQVDFVPLHDFEPVHEHVSVECDWNNRCGSWSLHLPLPPRNVRMRLRYHEDGETFLESPLAYFRVDAGPDHLQRSALLYGVFDENNERVQWRLRHQFPSLRNEEAEALGLRRRFRISEPGYGDLDINGLPVSAGLPGTNPGQRPGFFADNPYGYGWLGGCPSAFTQIPASATETSTRAVFQDEPFPVSASRAPYACATGEVWDGRGVFTTSVWAQKNPEVEPAFAIMRTPIQTIREIRYFFDFCLDNDDTGHRVMQQQRLLMGPEHVVCIDDATPETLQQSLFVELSRRIDAERRPNEDLALYIGLHRGPDTDWVAAGLESALAAIFEVEINRSTPRLAGAFVFDSEAFFITDPAVRLSTLWCPSFPELDLLDGLLSGSTRSCSASLVELPEVTIQNVDFASLPILPSRANYDSFAEKYGTDFLGSVKSISAKSPLRATESENVQVGVFEIATYFDDERISAGENASFSYCETEDSLGWNLVFRSAVDGSTQFLFSLAEWHEENRESVYDLGLLWDSTFYLEILYGTFAVAQPEQQSTTLLDQELELRVTLPLGPEIPGQLYPFGDQWTQTDFDLRDVLLRCNRFCNHPTFDAAGIYQIRQSFRSTYAKACYVPVFPAIWEGGFPNDP